MISQVARHIFIGNQDAATSRETLVEYDITALISIRLVEHFRDDPNLSYLKVDVFDSERNIASFFADCFLFIEKAISERKNVLIFDSTATNRSPAFAIAFIMFKSRCSLKQAFLWVKSRRPEIAISDSFLYQLLLFEEYLFGESITDKNSVPYVDKLSESTEPTSPTPDGIDTDTTDETFETEWENLFAERKWQELEKFASADPQVEQTQRRLIFGRTSVLVAEVLGRIRHTIATSQLPESVPSLNHLSIASVAFHKWEVLASKVTEELGKLFGEKAASEDAQRFFQNSSFSRAFDAAAVRAVTSLSPLIEPLTAIAAHHILKNKNAAKVSKKVLKDEDFAKSTAELQNILPRLKDKTLFSQYHYSLLSQRLLEGGDVSQERDFLAEMQENFPQLATKVEALSTDLTLASELNKDFQDATMDQNPPISVRVLSSSVWPASAVVPGDVTRTDEADVLLGGLPQYLLPEEIQNRWSGFSQYYLSKYQGRTLRLCPQLGTAEIQLNLDEKYVLTVSTYAMLVLCLFEHADSLSFSEIQENTKIDTQSLTRTLKTLAYGRYAGGNAGIVTKQPDDATTFAITDRFDLNKRFRHSQKRILVKF